MADIIREFHTSPFVYDPADSRKRTVNPDYHLPILLGRDGGFYDEQERQLDPESVPASIKEEATRLLPDTPMPPRSEVAMDELMTANGVDPSTGIVRPVTDRRKK